MFPGIAAVGIGALLGGLGAKQRGGNFLKGALTGAALGGVGGMLGAKFGGGAGGPFGFGKSMMGWAGPMAAIGMGTEMMGQGEANRMRKLQQQNWLDEEEDRRVARLNKYAGYDVTDPKNFLTPQSYFGAARGGLAALPHYANGGFHDVPMEESGPTMDPEIMQIPMGQEGSFEEENEGIVGLELAGLTDEEMSELQALQSLSIVTPEDHPQYEKIQIRLQELMGRMKVAKGGHINRPGYDEGGITNIHPGTEDEGFTYDVDIDDEKYDFSFDERLTEDPEERKRILEILKYARAKQPEGRLLQDTVDTTDQQMSMLGDIPNPMMYRAQGGQVNRPGYDEGGITELASASHPDEGYYDMFFDEHGRYPKDREELDIFLEGMDLDTFQAARGGIANRPGYFLGGLAALLGAGVLGSKLFGKREETKAPIQSKWNKGDFKIGRPVLPNEDEEDNQIGLMAQGGIADLDMRGGGHSIGPGTGTSDDVPAMLSDGEFVMTANAVRNLGGGDRMVGAQRMYQMMNSLDPNSQSPGEMNVAGYG